MDGPHRESPPAATGGRGTSAQEVAGRKRPSADSVADHSATATEIYRRRARHDGPRQKPSTSEQRIKVPVADWLWRTLPEADRHKFTPAPWRQRLSRAEPLEFDGDPDRRAHWLRILRECDGNQADADLRMQREHPLCDPRKRALSLAPSKDWSVRHAAPDPELVRWLHTSRVQFAKVMSDKRNTTCEQCGIHVVLARPRKRIFCSEQCSREWYNAHRPKARHAERVCEECGTIFKPKRTDAQYCSSPCRQAAYRKRGVAVLSDRRNSRSRRAVAIPAILQFSGFSIIRNRLPPVLMEAA